MITRIFNGKIYFNKMIFKLLKNTHDFNASYNKSPVLSIIVIGNLFSTNIYIKNKIIACIKTNIKILTFKFSKTIHIKSIESIIHVLNTNTSIHSILIQLPLPKKTNKNLIFNIINPEKDIDMLNAKNFATFILNHKPTLYSCTSHAVLTLLKLININIKGLNIIIFGFNVI